MKRSVGVVLVTVALTVLGCAPVERVISSLAPSPLPTEVVPGEAEIADAMAFRELVGLRADEAWVREVAANPAATLTYGVPLMPFEDAELARRAANAHDVAPIVEAYGAEHADEYGGVYIDNAAGGVVVVTFTANVEAHEAALRKLLAPNALIDVREAVFTSGELNELQERIATDDSLRSEGIFVLTTAADEAAGIVTVELSTERLDAEAVLRALYGPAVRTTIVDPTGAFLKPRGVIAGRVIDDIGAPVEAALQLKPLFADIALDSMGIGTQRDGTFVLDDQLVGRWRITAEAEGHDPGSAETDVMPGRVSRIEIVLPRSP